MTGLISAYPTFMAILPSSQGLSESGYCANIQFAQVRVALEVEAP